MDFSNKNIVVVGGLGVIPYEACKNFVLKNASNLVVLDAVENPANIKQLQSLNQKCNTSYIKLDITDKAAIEKAIKEIVSKMKYIDILINGAGILSDRNIELTININLLGVINTTFAALPYMDKNKFGRGGIIVNVASVLGLEPCPPCAVYCASKFGVMGFSRSLADPYYYNLTGVSVMTFCPGLTETPLKNNIKGKDTFDYSGPLTDDFLATESQTAQECGSHLAESILRNKNGTIWISDLGVLRTVEPKVYWEAKVKK